MTAPQSWVRRSSAEDAGLVCSKNCDQPEYSLERRYSLHSKEWTRPSCPCPARRSASSPSASWTPEGASRVDASATRRAAESCPLQPHHFFAPTVGLSCIQDIGKRRCASDWMWGPRRAQSAPDYFRKLASMLRMCSSPCSRMISFTEGSVWSTSRIPPSARILANTWRMAPAAARIAWLP